MTTTGERLRRAREVAGMTQMDVIVRMRGEMPRPFWISQSKLQRLEAGKDADPFLLSYLASLYGVKLSELSPEAYEALADERVQASLNIAWSGATAFTAEPILIGAGAT